MDRRLLRVGVLSTYAPRACGLATFAADLEGALRSAPGIAGVNIISMVGDEAGEEADIPQPQVIARIKQEDGSSYRPAAHVANAHCDVVIVQHEFGIFGGDDGVHLLRFLAELRVPAVLTLHTVLPVFTPGQAAVLRAASELVQTVTVFTPTARTLLVRQAIASGRKIHVVPHGAPDILYEADRCRAREALGLHDRFVISTFGLISPGKGLELAVEALPAVIAAVPSALLVIAGRTHPGIRRRDGENYRDGLLASAGALGISGHVRFMNEFMPVASIANLLAGTDVFITPYVNPEQIVSGALTFALAAGCPVVSTEYQYAQDQLSGGAGAIVVGRRPQDFANAILRYALNDGVAAIARATATAVGATMRWSEVGRQTAMLCQQTVGDPSRVDTPRFSVGGVGALPKARAMNLLHGGPPTLPVLHPSQSLLSTRHLERLVDDTGIIQHATGAVPLLSSGYCVDDVARLIPVAYTLSKESPRWESVVARSIAFLGHAVSDPASDGPDGGAGNVGGARLHNFLSWNRTWLDAPHFGDHVGRAAWGLSAVAADTRFAEVASPLLRGLLREWPEHAPLHSIAYALLAQVNVPWLVEARQLDGMVSRLVLEFELHSCEGWEWFEPTLRYDHARFCQALIAAGALAENNGAVELGLRTLRWYDSVCDQGDFFRFPGHRGVAAGEPIELSGDEQPLEALALVQAHGCAFSVTNDAWHRSRALRAHEWFMGRNRLGNPMVDGEGGCCDGLEPTGMNRNQGAESTLAYCASLQFVAAFDLRPRERLVVLPALVSPASIVS